MKRSKTLSKIVDLACVCAILLLVSNSLIAQVSPRMPAPNRNLTPPGQQKPNIPTGRQMGTIMGYVYWDASALQYNHSSPCQGLSVSLGVGTPPGGSTPTFEQFTPFGNASSSFTALNNIGSFAVCAYSVKNVPLSPADLQVQIHVQQSAFVPAANPAVSPTANNPNSPIRIPGGTCNKLAPAIPSASVLGSGWWTCGAYAYNVDFILQPVRSVQLMSATGGAGGMQPASGGAQVAINPSPSTGLLLRDSGPAGTPSLRNPGPPGEPSWKNPGPGGTQAQASSGTILNNRASAVGSITDGTRQPDTAMTRGATGASKVELNPQPLPPKQLLTNRDVVTMLNARLAESVILFSLRSSQHKFDFSPSSCRDLQRAHVTANILNAMGGDGRMRPCPAITGIGGSGPGGTMSNRQAVADSLNPGTTSSAVSDYRPYAASSGSKGEPNPQPLPPSGTSAGASPNGLRAGQKARVGPVLSAPKLSRKITNPKAVSRDAEIIAVLQKQRQAADAEGTQMRLGIPTNAIHAQPSTTMSATGSGGMLAASTNVQRASNAGTISPGTVSTSSVNRYATLQAGMIPGLALQCGHDPSFRILTISGGPHPAIFTPDTRYNFYTITGCSFGDPGPNSKVYIYYQSSFHQDFQIEEWSDNWIKLHLDSSLTGVDDQSNVTLVIQRSDSKQTSRSGYQFYAGRQTVLLRQIPRRYFSLNGLRPDQSVIQNWKPTYTSASSPSVRPNLPGLSAEVHWDITTDPDGTIVGGSDIYDVGHLHSTFVLDSAWMEWKDVSCDPNNYQFATSKNNWSIDWYGDTGVQVGWQGQMCQNKPGSCGGAFQPDCFVSLPESNYGVNISVTGPRGIDPWTGKPGS